MPVSLGNGAYKFVARNSSANAWMFPGSSAVLIPLQQYDCNGTAAQSLRCNKYAKRELAQPTKAHPELEIILAHSTTCSACRHCIIVTRREHEDQA